MSGQLEYIAAKLEAIESIVHGILHMEPISGSSVVVTGLDDISTNLGLIKAGEFRSGAGQPGSNFTGIRIGAPGWTYGGVAYSIVGLNNETLEFGISHTDGRLYAAAGDVCLSQYGISMTMDTSGVGGYVSFKCDNSGTIHDIGYLRGWYAGGTSPGLIQIVSERRSTHPWTVNTIQLAAVDATGTPSTTPAYLELGDNSPAIYGTGGYIFHHGILLYDTNLRRYVDATHAYTGYIFVPLTSPLTSTSWDGDAHSTTAKTVVDLSTVFSAPAGIKAALVYFSVRDSDSAASDTYLILSPNDTAGSGMVVSPMPVNNRYNRGCVVVPCDENGDFYYQIAASGSGTFDVHLQIWGYWI